MFLAVGIPVDYDQYLVIGGQHVILICQINDIPISRVVCKDAQKPSDES